MSRMTEVRGMYLTEAANEVMAEWLRHRDHVFEGHVGDRGAHPGRQICRRIPLLVLHDFDSAGIIIRDTLENDNWRYSYRSRPQIIDLGFHYRDIRGLPSEPNSSSISDERLAQAGLDQAAIDFLRDKRVELNALTSRQLLDFVEAKLKQRGIRKVIATVRP
jgi:hypothetical protein